MEHTLPIQWHSQRDTPSQYSGVLKGTHPPNTVAFSKGHNLPIQWGYQRDTPSQYSICSSSVKLHLQTSVIHHLSKVWHTNCSMWFHLSNSVGRHKHKAWQKAAAVPETGWKMHSADGHMETLTTFTIINYIYTWWMTGTWRHSSRHMTLWVPSGPCATSGAALNCANCVTISEAAWKSHLPRNASRDHCHNYQRYKHKLVQKFFLLPPVQLIGTKCKPQAESSFWTGSMYLHCTPPLLMYKTQKILENKST